MKGKKAQEASLLLLVFTLIAMSVALGSFYVFTSKVFLSVEPPVGLIDTVYEKGIIDFYVKESGRLASQKAFFSIAEKGASSGDCKLFGKYVIWEDGCQPGNVEEEFLTKIKGYFNYYTNLYPSIGYSLLFSDPLLDEGVVKTGSKEITLEISDKQGYVKYDVSFTFNSSLELSLGEEGVDLDSFEKIHEKAIECKNKDAVKVKECMWVYGWKTGVELSGDYLLFDMETEKRYFIDNEFKPILLRFALAV